MSSMRTMVMTMSMLKDAYGRDDEEVRKEMNPLPDLAPSPGREKGQRLRSHNPQPRTLPHSNKSV